MFATPREELRQSAEAETYEDAVDIQQGDGVYGEGGGCNDAYGGEGAAGGGGERYSDAAASGQAYAGDGYGGGGGEGEGGELDGRQQDSYGLPSEASLFRDLPDFLRDTTDE